MILLYLTWDWLCDTMLQVLKKYYSGGILGHDKEGAVVKLELLGKLDMKGLMRSTRRTDLER